MLQNPLSSKKSLAIKMKHSELIMLAVYEQNQWTKQTKKEYQQERNIEHEIQQIRKNPYK